MEVKAGYKESEVGVIPEDWGHTRIRGIASGARNAIVGGPFGSDLVSRDYVDEGVPVIRGQNMGGQRVSGNFAFVSAFKANSLEANLARPGDIVFTQRGTLGQVSLVPDAPFDRYLVSQSQMKLSVNRAVADPLFFFYVFNSEEQQELIRQSTIQTGVPHINLGILRDIPVQLPPLSEQHAIAVTLSDVDALIGALDQLIAKKRDLKQAAMQQLLTGDQRLPGFHGEWEVKRFSDIADKSIPWSIGGGPFGSNLKASDYVTDGVRIIQLQNIGDGRFHDDYAIYTSEEKADELLSNNIFPGEIILSKMGDPVARCCFVPCVDRRYLMASDGIRLAVDPRRFDKRFVHDYINSVYFRKKAIEASTGSTRQRIGLTELKQLPFVAPPLAKHHQGALHQMPGREQSSPIEV